MKLYDKILHDVISGDLAFTESFFLDLIKNEKDDIKRNKKLMWLIFGVVVIYGLSSSISDITVTPMFVVSTSLLVCTSYGFFMKCSDWIIEGRSNVRTLENAYSIWKSRMEELNEEEKEAYYKDKYVMDTVFSKKEDTK